MSAASLPYAQHAMGWATLHVTTKMPPLDLAWHLTLFGGQALGMPHKPR